MENQIKIRLLDYNRILGKRNQIIDAFESQAKALIKKGIAVEVKEGDDIISPEPWRIIPKKPIEEVIAPKEPVRKEIKPKTKTKAKRK